jgi:thiol-disulfide isomerase/thioredoxin
MRRLAAPAALLAVLLLAGCTQTGAQAPDSGSVSIDGVEEWHHPTTAPVSFSGPTADGRTFRSSAYAGQVLVVNFWYAGCGPCIAEAPDLERVAKDFAGKGVQFVGVNIRDEAGEAQSFARQHAVSYPSIVDQANGGAAQLAFADSIQPNATPTTLVVGKRGRVIGRILGPINESVLATLIKSARSGQDS